MSVAEIVSDIENLVSPTQGNPCLTIEGAFFQKLNETITDNSLNHLNLLRSSLLLENPFQDEQWWRYLCNLMEKLLELKNAFACANEKDSLLSVNQFQTIKSSLQILVSLGILANLSPGIGIDLEQRSKFTKDILPNSNSQQKHYCLNVVLRCLMSLREEETFKRVLVSSYIGDCLAVIFQLILQSTDPNIIKDQNNKSYLEKQLSCLLEETSQPILIRELMLLNGNKDCPPKLARALRLIMTERLMKENGVIATAKAILDVAGDENSPKHWATLSVIAKLIATPHKNPNYRDYVYPQILKLLSTSELQYAQIATLCIRTVHEMEPEICEKYFIDKICSPFLIQSTEESLNFSIECLYNCIGIPASQHWALPTSLFKKIYISLFRLYCFVVNSASHVKSKLKCIILSILSNDMDYKGFIFGTISVKFSFGENGGVFTKFNEEDEEEEMLTPWGDATDILLDLIEDDLNKVKLFQAVIISLDVPIERKVVGARVLSELCTVPAVLKFIEDKPETIVIFIKSLLENNYDNELICVGLMVLSVFLNSDKKQDWHIFDTLVEPLKQFKNKSNNVELRVLADDLYSMILTRGVLNEKQLNDKKFKSTLEKTKQDQCAQALAEVTDSLLPVRAHALRTLGKLIITRDPEAEKNKENIFCIFKENLKCDDSYVYLSAVEGLSSFAGMFPDDVLVTLTEQFVHSKDSEIRLKVGEVLIRVIRILGEMAAVYKNEIINALLFGCRDSDHIVRASSLSNLGELCRILSFRINTFLIEIFECIRSIFETDKAMEPRRAAVMLLTLLLKGLGSDALQVLEPVLLNIYRLLKFIYNYDKDDITRLHAQLAIEELNASTIMFLKPPQDFKKHIFVLNPPN